MNAAPVLPALPYFGDNLAVLAEIETALERHAIGPSVGEAILLRASEHEKLARVLALGSDRVGYPGDKRWRHDPRIAHEDLILATTPQENRDTELAGDPEASSSLRKLPGIPAPMILVYAAACFEALRPKSYRFLDPADKVAALRAVIPIRKLERPRGWFSPEEGRAYRSLVDAALRAPQSRGVIVELGCWLGRSTSYIATLCASLGARLIAVDHYLGSSDRFDAAYKETLASRDVAAEFLANIAAMGAAVDLRRACSLEVAPTIAPGALDLVFLDGSHDHAAVAADIAAWRPRLRPGGVLAGHDLSPEHPGVVAAVEAAAAAPNATLSRGPGSLWSLTWTPR